MPTFNPSRSAVVNDVMTYLAVAKALQERGVCVIAWEDTKGSRHNILFAVRVPQFGRLDLGLQSDKALFVAVMRVGSFAFDAEPPGADLGDIYPSYVAEKLGLSPTGYTTEAVTKLVNGVLAAYHGLTIGEGA